MPPRVTLPLLIAAILICATTFSDTTRGKQPATEAEPSQAVVHNQLTPQQAAEGWLSLFDGQTLFGWQHGEKADWQVHEGTLRATKGEVDFLMTTNQFADFQLHVEFLATPTTNSGVFFRTPFPPVEPPTECYELNIAPLDNPFPTGSLVARHLHALSKVQTFKVGDNRWHSYDVEVRGHKVKVSLDGQQLYEYQEQQPTDAGRIGLQFRAGEIRYRNVRLRPLSLNPIFDGKTLAGWNEKQADQSKFEVTAEGELRVLNGRGQLETDKSYGNFTLQLDCRVDGDGLNSGVFFRCIPGDFLMGYECQISNAMKENEAAQADPTLPADCGTGGIFRRQNARRIVAKDREWFKLTLQANGPHMAAWVNGHQVSDWTDDRPPHENPRKGLRLKPGTLAIQGHDPTTDIRFRNIRLSE